jgi:hypothetical protein
MPFDGNKWNDKKLFPYKDMVKTIKGAFPDFKRCDDEDGKNDTSKAWRVPGYRGKVIDLFKQLTGTFEFNKCQN